MQALHTDLILKLNKINCFYSLIPQAHLDHFVLWTNSPHLVTMALFNYHSLTALPAYLYLAQRLLRRILLVNHLSMFYLHSMKLFPFESSGNPKQLQFPSNTAA